MSIETIRKCDKCDKVVGNNQEFFTIGLVISDGNTIRNYDGVNPKFKEHRCIDCMIQAGLQQRSGKKDLEPAVEDKMTLDDFVKELVREVIDEEGV